MHPPSRYSLLFCCHYFISILLICSSTLATVDLRQTIPQDGLACPNNRLQLTCTSSGNVLILEVESYPQEQFTESDSVNASLVFGDFVAVLVVQNTTTIAATITNEMVTSNDNGVSITCAGGSDSENITITIAELSAVENIDYASECDLKSLDLIVTFNWKEPSMLGACSVADMPLQYLYFIEFNNSQFTNKSTNSTSYQLMNVPQGMDLEITITPTLPFQGLTGPRLSSTVNLVSISCIRSISSSAPTSSSSTPTSSSPGDPSENSVVIVASLIVVVVVTVLLLILVIVVIIAGFSRKHKPPKTAAEPPYEVRKNPKDETNTAHKAFQNMQDVLAEQLEHASTSAANYAFSARLIPEETYDTLFATDMRTKPRLFKATFLVRCILKKIKTARSREEAKTRMEDFYGCLRSDSAYSGLIESLKQKVTKFEKDEEVTRPEYDALLETDTVPLVTGSVQTLATNAYAKELIKSEEYHFIISGGDEAKQFVNGLLIIIGQRIQAKPELLQTFITKVLDKIGPPISELGKKLRKMTDSTTGQTC